jgi:hypothetical protein
MHDVIVVGARCAGSPLAMMLAGRGYRSLLVDRATFPSDTVSTHVIHPPGVAALKRWGLLDQVVATGCPLVGRYSFDFGPLTLAGAPGTPDSPYATLGIASLQPPDEQMIQLVSAIAGNQPGMDAFARLNSGVTSPAEFFAPENVARLAGGVR